MVAIASVHPFKRALKPLLLLGWLWIGWLSTYAFPSFGTTPQRERGYRPVHAFSARDVGGGGQNFSVTQSQDGTLFIGNLHGVLEYDGAYWRLVHLPNQAAAMVLAQAPNGRVLVGGFNEVGYLESDRMRQPQFHSLRELLPEQYRNFGEVTRILQHGDGVVIETSQFLFSWSATEKAPIQPLPKSSDTHLFEHLGQTYRRVGGQTLDMQGQLAPSILDRPILFSLGRDTFILKDGSLEVAQTAFQSETSQKHGSYLAEWLKNSRVSNVIATQNGHYLIATRDKGLLMVDDHLEPVERFDTDHGLPGQDVRGTCLSQDGRLWLALNNAIATVDISSPVYLFDERSGVRSSTNCFGRQDDHLFFGTSDGLYYFEPNPDKAGNRVSHLEFTSAKRVDLLPTSVWCIRAPNKSDVFIGTNDGAYYGRNLTRGDELKIIDGTDGLVVYEIGFSPSLPDMVLLGTASGLAIARNTEGGWRNEGFLPGSPHQIRSIKVRPEGVWLGTTFDGAWLIENLTSGDGSLNLGAAMTQFGQGETELFLFGDEISFVAGGKTWQLNATKDHLIPHRILEPNPIQGDFFKVVPDLHGHFWFNSHPISRLTLKNEKVESVHQHIFRNIPAYEVQNMYMEPDGRVWLTSDEGIVKIEPHAFEDRKDSSPSFNPRIGRVWYGSNLLPLDPAPETDKDLYDNESADFLLLEYSPKRMRIEFAPLAFEPNQNFQYRMLPTHRTWSQWSDRPFTEYTNLREGNYLFQFRMMRSGQQLSPISQFSFEILPPWHRTGWAYLGYLVLLVACLFAFARWRSMKLHQQALILRRRVKRQTRELETALSELHDAKAELEIKNHALEASNQILQDLSTKDGLTGLSNRRHLDHVLEEEWKRAWRLKTQTSVVLLDIDYFKRYNDHYGHLAGDTCLQTIANYLSDMKLRSSDLVARYGGEEFVIVLCHCDLDAAYALAEEIRTGVQALGIQHEESPFGKVTSSLGVACMIANQDNRPAHLLALADDALYLAKSLGRNQAAKMEISDPNP